VGGRDGCKLFMPPEIALRYCDNHSEEEAAPQFLLEVEKEDAIPLSALDGVSSSIARTVARPTQPGLSQLA
jgi:hypothetical protein